jgi:DNA-3-methyladenine glycosylase I
MPHLGAAIERVPDRARCPWCGSDPLYVAYHDQEWGVPVHDDRRLFEMLVLEGAQAGLSWLTILRKRPHYRAAFADFDPERVARFGAREQRRLLANPGLVRNRLKLESAVRNARAFLALQDQHGCFADWLWSFVDGEPVVGRRRTMADVPARTPLSDTISKELRQAGCNFVGSTIVYAFLQATGVVDDHLLTCWKRKPRRPTARASR